jgi:cell division septation protein DedD
MPRMPAMPLRSNAFTPAPNTGETGIMSDLYRLHLGTIHAAYYQQHFQRFESAGKATPSWNHGAAFFTLAWLLLRKLWRPAALYGAVLLAVLALWWWGLHGQVPLPLEAAVCTVVALLMYVVPGVMGNGLYYHHVRKQTLHTLTSATSLAQARAQLGQQAVTKERLQLVVSVQALVLLGTALAIGLPSGTSGDAFPPPPQPAAVSGPPDLVIPAVGSLPPMPPPLAMPNLVPDTLEHASIRSALADETAAPPTFSELTMAQANAAPSPADLASAASLDATQPPATQVPVTVVPATTQAAAPSSKERPAAATLSKKQMTAPATSTSRKNEGRYYLNAGVYAQSSNVDAAVQQLKSAKLHTQQQRINGKNGALTRLRVGPFDTRQQAEQAAVQVRKLRIPATVVEASKG